LEAVKPLNDKISLLEGTQVIKSRQTQLDSLLSDCKDENYKKSISETFNYMTAISDEDFSKWTQTITDGVKSANQNLANDNLSKQGSPIDPKHYGAKGVEQTIIEAIEKGETSTAVEGKPLIPTK
jgi:PBP1b-binding outer membrane lipoprotein LpoB